VTIISGLAFQSACVAVSSRLVGSAFRTAEVYNPQLQQAQVLSDPTAVMKREVSTLGLAWLLSYMANLGLRPLAKATRLNLYGFQFLTTIVGTFLAESFGRFIAYRKQVANSKFYPGTGYRSFAGVRWQVSRTASDRFVRFGYNPDRS
jgi:hypothetical protein